MKKITFSMIALLCAILAFAAWPEKQFSAQLFRPTKSSMQLEQRLNAKQAPEGLALKALKNDVAKARGSKKTASAASLEGEYIWNYLMASGLNTDIESLETNPGQARVTIAAAGPEVVQTTASFNFNEMKLAVSSGSGESYVADGDITETLELTDKDVSLAISPAAEGKTATRFWEATSNDDEVNPQLRCYSNTLTFSVPEGKTITSIVFNYNGKYWGGSNNGGKVTADTGEIKDDASLKAATWTGEAETVVFTIEANTQINSINVTYVEVGEVEERIAISGMFDNALEATIESDEEGDYIVIPKGQLGGTSSYGNYTVDGIFYFEGDDEFEAGWYNDDIYGVLQEDGSIVFSTWIGRTLSGGQYDGYSLTPYFVEGSTLTPAEPLTVVEAPDDLVTEEYSLTARNYKDDADVTGSVFIGFDGNDVYVKGLCTLIPEAWAKGTLDGTTITFAYGQYFGNYADTYDMYLNTLMVEDVVFDYDAEAGTLTAQNEFFLVDNDQYYFDSYRGAVLKKVIEVAAMPANPAITALTSGQYGWFINFNVPNVDTEGNGLAASKLSYMIYTDIEGEVAPLTFTSATHEKLTEDMTEIPFGFTDSWDFYSDVIYLNDLYSEDWNKIGIQSIYRGGGEENVTEIQWLDIKPYSAVVTENVTFDFNAMDVATSSNDSHDGDITAALTLTEGDVTLTISPADEHYTNAANRFWGTAAGPQLRVYSGTLTVEAPEGSNLTQIVFNHNGKWGDTNSADSGELTNDADAKAATWTGKAQKVVFTIGQYDESTEKYTSGNTQINSIVVTYAEAGTEPVDPVDPVDPDGLTFDFEDGTMQGWTIIDADGDGYNWTIGATPSFNTYNESNYCVYSESYDNNSGALTPDNFLVSPQMKLDGKISFYACAQDGAYPAEKFAVAVSTAGNTDAADFTNVQEWTMTASRANAPTNARGMFRGPRKTPGNWYLYTVNLSGFEGVEGYVAIRHFDCTDNFYLVVDNITLETSGVFMPDFTITPAEGVVKSLSDFAIVFNNYDVELAEGAKATLTNNTTSTNLTTDIEQNQNTLIVSFEETTEPGDYTLALTGVKNGADEIELEFNYTIEAKPDVVVLPEGLEAETWYFSATASQSNIRNQEVAVAIDGSDIYIQGLNVDYLPEAWVKGTIEGNTATFPTGQYFGAFEYDGTDYDMFFVGYSYDADEIADVVFDFDAEAGTLTTDTWIVISSQKDEVKYYEYYEGATITRELPETPDLVTLPEGVETEAWTIDGTYADNYSSDNIVRATEVAFDGTDIYVKGIPFWFEDAWMKGTIDAESGIATFPTGQFVGEDEYGWEFMLGTNDGETICDIEFTYDAEAKTLTQLTNYIIENGGTPDELAPYGYWTDMLIYAGEPVIEEPVEAPEGLETETYLFTASCLENGKEEAVDYSFQTQVGFDGKDVYFTGVSDDTFNMWLKGTLSEDGKTVTIPANQYMGQATVLWYTFNYYFTAVAEDGETMEDIVLNYDAENAKFTTDQTLVLHDGKRALGEPYQTFTNVVITKMVEFAATPADPSIDDFKLTDTAYPKAYFIIPAEDVDGNPLLTAKLFYTIWYMEEGSEETKQFTAVAGEDEYSKLPNDMTEIPYDYNDSWDIYKGGETFYFNPTGVVENWTKFGIQSIYYGGGERNTSNIVWSEEITTGIADIAADNQNVVIFDLQGRRVAAPAKGLYIMNGKKVVVK